MNTPDRQEQEPLTGSQALHAAEVMRLQAARDVVGTGETEWADFDNAELEAANARDISAAATVALPRPVEGPILVGDPFDRARPIPPENYPLPWSATVTHVFDAGPFVDIVSANGERPFNICARRTGKELADLVIQSVNAYPALLASSKLDKERIAALEGELEQIANLSMIAQMVPRDAEKDARGFGNIFTLAQNLLNPTPAVAPTSDGGAK